MAILALAAATAHLAHAAAGVGEVASFFCCVDLVVPSFGPSNSAVVSPTFVFYPSEQFQNKTKAGRLIHITSSHPIHLISC